MSTPAYRFPDFVADLELITSASLGDEEKIRHIQRKLRLLISGGAGLPGDSARTAPADHYGRYLLHEDPRGRFVVVQLVWGPGQGTPIHDHSTWGVAGIVENELRIVNYDRVDDGSRPGVAELRESSAIEAPAGTVTYLQPPNDVIHLIENPTAAPSRSIHVYGKSVVACNRFDLERRNYAPWRLSYDAPCPC